MRHSQEKALEITTQIVVATLNSSQPAPGAARANAVLGQEVSAYFTAIYNTISAITAQIPD